jgi:ligand-binding sensor domain-containing protein
MDEGQPSAQMLVRRSRLLRGACAAVAGLSVVVAAVCVFALFRHALGVLEEVRGRGGARNSVRFERERLNPPGVEGVRLFQSTRSARAVARFKDSYFEATDGGLVELSPSGEVIRRYGVLDGLGESDLTCLAAYGARLFIGTRSKGLLAFDGKRFERYWWPGRDARSVTSLFEDQGKLLVGTFAGGLLEFDGEGFAEVSAGEAKPRLDAVTFAARYGPRLYLGTFNRGLWVSEGGRWAHFTSADGLMSDRVVGVVERGGEALAASDFGLAAAAADRLVLGAEAGDRRAWQTSAVVPSLSSVADFEGRIILCRDDGEIAALDAAPAVGRVVRAQDVAWEKTGAAQSGARLAASDGFLWLTGSGGVSRSKADETDEKVADADADGRVPGRATERKGWRQISFTVFGGDEPAQTPTTNIISALAFDAGGNLWAGSFRNGLDVFAPSGARLAHLESDELREVNALVADGAGRVFAATSQGIVRLEPTLRPEWLNAQDVPAGNSVMHVALLRSRDESGASRGESVASPSDGKRTAVGELAVATSKGLSLGVPGSMRALTTVQGLPSNSVYSVWSDDGARVYAGTLGGLAEVSSGRVVRVFKDSNSALTNNWVTAVRGAGGRLFIGTYGGGVFELLPSGDLRAFAAETGKAFVNQNAMWADDERLYVGTLDGVLVLDLRSQKWTRVRDELPMPTVLSIAGRGGQIYFGTTGGLARFDRSFFDSAAPAGSTSTPATQTESH